MLPAEFSAAFRPTGGFRHILVRADIEVDPRQVHEGSASTWTAAAPSPRT